MRISDDGGKALSSVYLALSDGEATDLIGALTELREADKGWHQHVSDASYEREITIYREDDDSAAF